MVRRLSLRVTAIAIALVLASSTVTPAVTLYVGLTGGKSIAYALVRGKWTRLAAADIPAEQTYGLPTLSDLDGDGDADALVGQEKGMVIGFSNAGTDAAPSWQRQVAWDVGPFGSRSAPALGDVDGDGDADLIVGNRLGQIAVLENTGTSRAPAWRDRPEWAITGIVNHAHPALGDLDLDGHVDLLVGTNEGPVVAFAGTGDAGDPFVRTLDWDPPAAGTRTTPGLGDLDGDGRLDLIVADGRAVMSAFRNTTDHWVAVAGWAPPDPGSGPVGLAMIEIGSVAPPPPPPPPPPPTGNRPPAARLMASPASGAAPLTVRLDASGSSDPDGDALTFTWDFDDASSGNGDPAVLVGMDAAYDAAKAARDANRFGDATIRYLDAVGALLPLTSNTTTGPVTKQGTNRVDRVARWYIQKIAHDLGGTFLFNDLGLPTCACYGRALQLSRESRQQAIAGGFPLLPSLNGTDANIAQATLRLTTNGCAVPPYEPQFGGVPDAHATGPVATHAYRTNGTYRATITVSDGEASATASTTITVGSAPPPPPPPPNDEPLQGFGAQTRGGTGGRLLRITEPTDAAVRTAFSSASKGNAIVRFEVQTPIEIRSPLPRLNGAFITIEGNGATLYGPRLWSGAAMIDVRGHDVIVRNLRLRNGGDNLRAQGRDAYNIVFSHISSTGAADDGISIGYGAHDVTVQYCFLAGNTRGIFMKYSSTTNVSIHHTWVMKYWIRGPLVSQAIFSDVRNVIVEDWTAWGVRFEKDASGNVVDSLFRLSPYADSIGGKSTSALRLMQRGAVFTAGNVFQGQTDRGDTGNTGVALPAPTVSTLPIPQMVGVVERRAGCMPRDTVDRQYIDTTSGWRVSESQPFRLGPGS